MKVLSILLIFIFITVESSAIERSRKQFLYEPSYLVFPLPYSLPGIGQGAMVTALAGNINDTNVDSYLIGITGDAEGVVFAVEDIHLLHELLILDVMEQRISKAVVNNYENRGMNSKKDDYSLIEVDKVITDYAKLTLTLFERRFELYGAIQQQKARIVKIRNSKGEIITDLSEPFISESRTRRIGVLLDYTDDRTNPKKGVRFSTEYISANTQKDVDPKFYTIDKSLSVYLPISEPVTLAFNIYQSDAHVTQIGEINPDAIKEELGMNCPLVDQQCLKAEQDIINMMINSRTNGTASGLGGDKRLRAYPGDRYSGAHTLYYATELRWNLSEEVRPFNFGIWKDVATGLQIALFYEKGSVSEKLNELNDLTKESYGGGFRLVSASGFVYRADFAKGDEGSEMTIMFSYPW